MVFPVLVVGTVAVPCLLVASENPVRIFKLRCASIFGTNVPTYYPPQLRSHKSPRLDFLTVARIDDMRTIWLDVYNYW